MECQKPGGMECQKPGGMGKTLRSYPWAWTWMV